ncbi:MAG TPA: single-stranded-DNA-specific exonuclease RecJ [Ruminococcaceae bacterium]|nr:single-stranded-DNA-specific exonuclease RecJ [Oscillospiraceae bacterium]
MKKWLCSPAPAGVNNEITAQFGELLGGVMLSRGITTLDRAREFFGCSSLSDPLLMKDMESTVDVIRQALDEGKKITVYGDYDCDGVTSTAMLYGYLDAMGAEVEYYIPDRSEGYGMNIPALEKILDQGTELIITVDNGVSAVEEAEYIRQRGAQLVITDHHQPPQELPVCEACVNPHRQDDNSPFKELCGAGVVLKLLCALEEDEEFVMEQYAELAAVGTIGDVMPLVGENRYIVRRGIEDIRASQNIGIDRLLRTAGVSPESVDATTVAFSICPRINAAGRIAAADKAVQLLMADSPEQAGLLSEELNLMNENRRAEEARIMEDVSRQLESDPSILRERVLVVSGEGWHHGVIGIVAARLLEKYGKPVLMISVENGEARGSARGIDGFSIYKLLDRCSRVLTKFGGHPKAGGFSLPADRVEDFRQMVYAFCRECYPKMPEYTVSADMEITGDRLTEEALNSLSQLEPCGEGNQRPVFLLRNCTVESKRALKDGRYTSFELRSGGVKLKALCFGIPFAKFHPEQGSMVDIIAAAELNEFRGVKSVTLKVQEIRPSGFREDRFFAAQRTYEEISRGEGCDSRLAPRVIPDRNALMAVYDLLRKYGGAMSAEELCIYGGSDLNYCMLRIALDTFASAGMAEQSADADTVRLIPVTHKTDLMASGFLADLRRMLGVQ